MGKVLERSIKVERAKKSAAKKAVRNGRSSAKKQKKQPTLAELNRRLFSEPDRLLRIAEANTLRLTGQPRL